MGPVQIPEAARREKRKACLLRSTTETKETEEERDRDKETGGGEGKDRAGTEAKTDS